MLLSLSFLAAGLATVVLGFCTGDFDKFFFTTVSFFSSSSSELSESSEEDSFLAATGLEAAGLATTFPLSSSELSSLDEDSFLLGVLAATGAFFAGAGALGFVSASLSEESSKLSRVLEMS